MELNPSNKVPIGTTKTGEPRDFSEDEAHQGAGPNDAAQAHYRADTDSSQKSLHHTLGPSRTQSSPGNHIHDGLHSVKLGGRVFDTNVGNEGQTVPALTISGSRNNNAALASIIALLENFVDVNDTTTLQADTWHDIPYGTNWGPASSFNGNSTFPGMQYKKDAGNDTVMITGLAASTGTISTIGTLPVGYRMPAGQRALLKAAFNVGGTVTPGFVEVTENGNITATVSVSGVTVASGTQVYINDSYPLRNLP
jgi:hypothetical protein